MLTTPGGVAKGFFGDESLADVGDFTYTVQETVSSFKDLLEVRCGVRVTDSAERVAERAALLH